MLLRTLVVAALLAAACHGHSPQSTTTVVGAAGGTAASAGGAVSLSFPPGALAADTPIGIAPRPADADAVAGTGWDFTPDGAHFTQPVQVTVRFDPAQLQGVDPSTLAMLHVASDGSRVLAGDQAVEVAAHTVSGSVDGFSGVVVVTCSPRCPIAAPSISATYQGSGLIDIDAAGREPLMRLQRAEADAPGCDPSGYLPGGVRVCETSFQELATFVSGQTFHDREDALSRVTIFSYRARSCDGSSHCGPFSSIVAVLDSFIGQPAALTIQLDPSQHPNRTATELDLAWTAVIGAASYQVERASGGAFAVIAAALAGTQLPDSGLSASTHFDYRVTAFDAAGATLAQGTFGADTLSLAGYTLTVSPNPVQVGVNSLAHATVTLVSDASFGGTVQLEAGNLPKNVTASFGPATLDASSPSAMLTLTTSGAAPGSYTADLIGSVGAQHTRFSLPITINNRAVMHLTWTVNGLDPAHTAVCGDHALGPVIASAGGVISAEVDCALGELTLASVPPGVQDASAFIFHTGAGQLRAAVAPMQRLDMVDGDFTEAHVDFIVESGQFVVTWSVNGRSPASSSVCADLQFDTVTVKVAQRQVSAACSDGRIEFSDMESGQQVVDASLYSSTGATPGDEILTTGQVNAPDLSGTVGISFTAGVVVRWTINGADPRGGMSPCGPIANVQVDVASSTSGPIVASCQSGVAAVRVVPEGPHQVTAQALDSGGAPLGAAVSGMVQVGAYGDASVVLTLH